MRITCSIERPNYDATGRIAARLSLPSTATMTKGAESLGIVDDEKVTWTPPLDRSERAHIQQLHTLPVSQPSVTLFPDELLSKHNGSYSSTKGSSAIQSPTRVGSRLRSPNRTGSIDRNASLSRRLSDSKRIEGGVQKFRSSAVASSKHRMSISPISSEHLLQPM